MQLGLPEKSDISDYKCQLKYNAKSDHFSLPSGYSPREALRPVALSGRPRFRKINSNTYTIDIH